MKKILILFFLITATMNVFGWKPDSLAIIGNDLYGLDRIERWDRISG